MLFSKVMISHPIYLLKITLPTCQSLAQNSSGFLHYQNTQQTKTKTKTLALGNQPPTRVESLNLSLNSLRSNVNVATV